MRNKLNSFFGIVVIISVIVGMWTFMFEAARIAMTELALGNYFEAGFLMAVALFIIGVVGFGITE